MKRPAYVDVYLREEIQAEALVRDVTTSSNWMVRGSHRVYRAPAADELARPVKSRERRHGGRWKSVLAFGRPRLGRLSWASHAEEVAAIWE